MVRSDHLGTKRGVSREPRGLSKRTTNGREGCRRPIIVGNPAILCLIQKRQVADTTAMLRALAADKVGDKLGVLKNLSLEPPKR